MAYALLNERFDINDKIVKSYVTFDNAKFAIGHAMLYVDSELQNHVAVAIVQNDTGRFVPIFTINLSATDGGDLMLRLSEKRFLVFGV